MTSTQKKYLPWFIWGLGAFFFFSEYFARVAPSVMALQLMSSFHVDALSLGTLSAFFYISYLGMQLPVGLLIDRYSMQKLLVGAGLICALGSFTFAIAPTVSIAAAGRFMIGFGAAFAFVSALKLALVWLPENRFGLFAGITQALGMLGAAFGEAPMSMIVERYGWRNTMYGIALMFLILAVLFYFFIKDKPRPLSERHVNHQPFSSSLKAVFSNPQSWWNALYIGLLYAPTAAFGELWGVTFLRQAHGLSATDASFAIGLIFIGWGVGGPICGWLSDRIGRRKPLMFVSSACGFLLLSIIIFSTNLPEKTLFLLMFLFGFTNTALTVSYALASEINPRAVAGTSLALANVASVIIGASLQPVIGEILDVVWDGSVINHVQIFTLANYRSALTILPICSLLSLFFAFFLKETYCKKKD